MDDKPGDRAGSDSDKPTSLVERAARRIVAGQPRLPPAAIELAPAGAAPVGADAAEEFAPNGAPPPVAETGIRDRILGEQSSADGATRPGTARGRSSKFVNIDIESLASRHLFTPQSKRNKTVEEMRLVKRMVLGRRSSHGDALSNTIIVTSALPEEGKTTVAINLAMSIAAEEDLRVLLIDADFVKPQALRQLGVSAEKGLIDVIQDPNMDIADVMLRTNIEKLSLIPSGQLHDRCTELLASARMRDLVAELASRYPDRILIFDSPPVLATTESVTLATHMGQVVFVVQAGRTRRQMVDSALELLGDRQFVGLVLNRAAPRLGSTEFGSYYGSYYGAHYGADRKV